MMCLRQLAIFFVAKGGVIFNTKHLKDQYYHYKKKHERFIAAGRFGVIVIPLSGN